jgi:hypothetical protein
VRRDGECHHATARHWSAGQSDCPERVGFAALDRANAEGYSTVSRACRVCVVCCVRRRRNSSVVSAGIPVATVAVDGAANAALLAVRMLAAGTEPLLHAKVLEYQQLLREQVDAKALALDMKGWKQYSSPL